MKRFAARFAFLTAALGIVCLAVFVATRVYRKTTPAPIPAETSAWDANIGALPGVALQPERLPENVSRAAPTPASAASNASGNSHDPIVAFDHWVHRYLDARNAAEKSALLAEGQERARARYRALFSLIESDPEAALAARVHWPVRANLPSDIVEWLEEPVSGVGDYYAIGAVPAGDPGPEFVAVRREAVVDGRRYHVYPYGSRLQMGTRRGVALHGIAVGGRLALLDSPIRVLDPGEPVAPGRKVAEVCGVSGKPTDLESENAASRTAVDTGDQVVYLCSAGHIAAFAESMGESTGAGVSAAFAEMPLDTRITTGTKTVLYIRVRFADQPADFEPQTAIGVYGTIAEANQFLGANSFGTLSVDADVTPVYVLPQTEKWYLENDSSGFVNNVLEAARAVARNPSSVPGNAGLQAYDYEAYDYDVVRYSGKPGQFQGQAHIGVRGMWMKVDSAGVFVHELGHNLGLWHANLWAPDDPLTVIGEGRNREYGDGFDSMSRNAGAHWHFNTFEKWRLGWLPQDSIETIATSGDYRLGAHDIAGSPSFAPGLALRVRRDEDRDYWFEFRQHEAWRSNRWLSNGLGVRWDPWEKSNGGSQLIDTTPGTPDGIMDSAVVVGRTFSDPVAGLHVTTLAREGSANPALEVAVRFDSEIGSDNRPPSVTLTALRNSIAVGETAELTAMATDPDGDALAFHWDFGDRDVGANAPTVSKTWEAPGEYRVRVVVSDMKGGTASASTLVRVGETDGQLIGGRVRDLAGKAVSDVWIQSIPKDYYTTPARSGWTDTDGRFWLTDAGPGAVEVVAAKPGWRFVPDGFLNPHKPGVGGEIDFVGVRVGFQVSGFVRDAGGLPVAGALVRMGSLVEPTDANGAFSFPGVEAGRHRLIAEKNGRILAEREVGVAFSDVSGVALREPSYTVSGEIVGFADPNGITVSDGVRSTVAVMQGTGENARLVFSLRGVPSGRCHLRVYQSGSSFSPVGFENPIEVRGDLSGIVFARDEVTTSSISGAVTVGGDGLEGAYVMAGGRSATTDSRGLYFLSGLPAGEYTVVVSVPGHTFSPAERQVTVGELRAVNCDFVSTRANQPPVIQAPAVVGGALAQGLVRLSVLAEDDGGPENLRYSWSATDVGEGPVGFTRNHANGASSTTAVFTATGAYRLRVTVTDAQGAEAVGDVWVQVPKRPLEVSINLPEDRIVLGKPVRFGIQYLDQFGRTRSPESPVPWSVSGGGTIDTDGIFDPSGVGADFQVTAVFDGRVLTQSFTVGYPDGNGAGVTREIWTGIPGESLAALKQLAAYPDSPNYTSVIGGGFETASGFDHNYGQRVRGYFLPPATGDYVFYIASDNESELWISPTSDPAGKVLVASVKSPTAPRSWEEQPGQVSALLHLTAGEAVYMEALHKEDAADDHLAVGVMLPGGVYERPIPAHRLLPWGGAAFDPPTITKPATADSAVVSELLETGLSVSASSEGGDAELTYTWSVVGGGTGPVVFLPNGSNAASRTVVRFSRAGDYRLRVTVRDSAGQTAESEVEVRVLETIESWRRTHFFGGQLDDPAAEQTVWGADADPDGDGVVNLLEYAYGLDPLVAGTDGVPEPIMVSVDGVEYLAIRFMTNPSATDVVVTPQASSDLRNWESGLVRMEDLPDGRVVYRDFLPADASDRRFLRVHVSGP